MLSTDKDGNKIPAFDEFLSPILKILVGGKEHYKREIIDKMVEQFEIPEEVRNLFLPSGMTYLYNRISWALTYLSQAGLIDVTGKGRYRITNAGSHEAGMMPDTISWNYLLKFDSFQEFKGRHKNRSITKQPVKTQSVMDELDKESPEINIYNNITVIRKAIIKELLSRLGNVDPAYFEKIVLNVVLKLGYGKNYEDLAKVVGRTGDGGIDGEIPQDKLGFEKIYLQAKRWTEGSVGSPLINNFIGALSRKHAIKGILITTSNFTNDAYNAVKEDTDHKIILINGEQLAELMIDYNIGVRPKTQYEIKEIDEDYFEEQ